MQDLMPKEWILLGAPTFFFFLCLCIWIVVQILPAWDARQVQRAARRREELRRAKESWEEAHE